MIMGSEPIGQTFVARHGGLRAVDIWLTQVEQVSGGEIFLELIASPISSAVITRAALPADNVKSPAFYVNWGRYPQLAGLAILPVAIWKAIFEFTFPGIVTCEEC